MTPRSIVTTCFLLGLVVAGAASGADVCGKAPAGEKAEYLGEDSQKSEVQLSSYRGQIVVISFWATWCPSCLRELPMLEALQREAGEQLLRVIAVNTGEAPRVMERFLQRWKTTPTMLITNDYNRRASRAFRVSGLPSLFVFRSDGSLETAHCGYTHDDFIKLVEELNALILRERAESAEQGAT